MSVQITGESLQTALVDLNLLSCDVDNLKIILNNINTDGVLIDTSNLQLCENNFNQINNDIVSVLYNAIFKFKNFLEQSDSDLSIESRNFVDVPLISQTDFDYPFIGRQNIKTSGCGITAFSMLASYVYDELITPDMVYEKIKNWEYFPNRKTNAGAIQEAAAQYGIGCKSAQTNEALTALKEGKMIICLINNSTHFVLVKGITEDGKWLVNDPYGPSYNDSNYRNKLENGFEMGYTVNGQIYPPKSELNVSNGEIFIFDTNYKTNNIQGLEKEKIFDNLNFYGFGENLDDEPQKLILTETKRPDEDSILEDVNLILMNQKENKPNIEKSNKNNYNIKSNSNPNTNYSTKTNNILPINKFSDYIPNIDFGNLDFMEISNNDVYYNISKVNSNDFDNFIELLNSNGFVFSKDVWKKGNCELIVTYENNNLSLIAKIQ